MTGCLSYKTQNTVKLHFCNKLECFLMKKILTCVTNALAQHGKIIGFIGFGPEFIPLKPG